MRVWNLAAVAVTGVLMAGGCGSEKAGVTTGIDIESRALPASARQVADTGALVPVATFTGAMPTGVTVSKEGRIFVCFPRWGDRVRQTVAEVKGGLLFAYPDEEMNAMPRVEAGVAVAAPGALVSVQSVVVDGEDRLWMLDTGSVEFGPTAAGGPKLVCVDLATDRVVKTILLPREAALETTYLNDVRFDLRRGEAGMAFVTDSSDKGPNAILVVDLASGEAWRTLDGHRSVSAEERFVPTVEGVPVRPRPALGTEGYLRIGADGIAISPDGRTLYWTAFAGRRLYSIETDLLADRGAPPERVEAAVKDLGDKGFASDGLESDAAGNVYLTDYENNAVRVLDPQGRYRMLVQDGRMLFPDTLTVTPGGQLYVMSNQLHRQAAYRGGRDERVQPVGVLFVTTAYSDAVRLTRKD